GRRHGRHRHAPRDPRRTAAPGRAACGRPCRHEDPRGPARGPLTARAVLSSSTGAPLRRFADNARPHLPAACVSEPTAARRKAALVFIFLVVLIDVLAFGLIIPVLPHLVEEFTGSTSRAALWIGVFGTVFAAIQFLCSPTQAALSDRYGRRPVILLSCLGLGLDFVIMALAPSLWWLLVARVFSGVFSASFSTANAYVADIVPADARAKSYGMIGAAFGVGF